mmetsp:Transcript_65655/g.183596  ORF Transcript_65655/g.183596 Transcript_65655/m.183596 type:complete len:441 (+) Transcript_65655:392-1714(+)
MSRPEGVLVRPPLDARQAVHVYLSPIDVLFLDLDQGIAVRPCDLQGDDLHDPHEAAAPRLLRQRGLALDQLLRQVGQGAHAILAELVGVDVVRRQVFAQLLLLHADRRAHQGRYLGAFVQHPQFHLLRVALGLSEPLKVACVLRRVLVREGPHVLALQPEALQGLDVCGPHDAFVELLPVHRPDPRVGRRVVVLLQNLTSHEVEAHLVVGDVQALAEQALGRANAVLVGVPLRPRQLIDVVPDAAIGILLGECHEVLLVLANPIGQATDHHINDADDAFVCRRVQHEAREAALHLRRELRKLLSPALTEQVDGDAVLDQHLADGVLAIHGCRLEVLCARHRPCAGLVHVPHLGATGGRPPIELVDAVGNLVHDLEGAIGGEVHRDDRLWRLGLRGRLLGLLRQLLLLLQSLHKLQAALFHAGVGALLTDFGLEVELDRLL